MPALTPALLPGRINIHFAPGFRTFTFGNGSLPLEDAAGTARQSSFWKASLFACHDDLPGEAAVFQPGMRGGAGLSNTHGSIEQARSVRLTSALGRKQTLG